MPSAKRVLYSTPGRIGIPLLLVGVSGLSTNMIAYVITQSSGGAIDAILSTRWSIAYATSGVCLTWYELYRISREINRQEYVSQVMTELQPDLVESSRSMIKEGKIEAAMDNIAIAAKLLKPGKAPGQ